MSDNKSTINNNDDLKSIINRVGVLTRMLRESMRELGLDKGVQKAVASIPDGKDRLRYIADMTAQAADKTLNSIDTIQPLQNDIHEKALVLQSGWQNSVVPQAQLCKETRDFIDQVVNDSATTKAELLDIMMAQDFQDLTGQVIKKMMELVEETEKQLLLLLMENAPPEVLQKHQTESLLNGPQVNPKKSADVVSSQSQVDDLLDELGF